MRMLVILIKVQRYQRHTGATRIRVAVAIHKNRQFVLDKLLFLIYEKPEPKSVTFVGLLLCLPQASRSGLRTG